MSGRIPADRSGYTGYTCVGIAPTFIQCVDCDENEYLKIPIYLGAVTDNRPWTDYSGGLPVTWPHPCSDTYTGAFLEVEYPDVAPVSVRGIGFKASWSGNNGGGYDGCYIWEWLDPSTLPMSSKGYASAGSDWRWFYTWYEDDLITKHYSDDNPAAQGNIRETWTVPSSNTDETRYGPFENPNATITFSYCEECPKESYKGPFELYLTRTYGMGYNVQVYAGKIVKSDGSIIEVPSRYIGVTVSSVYIYYEVDEDVDPASWIIASASNYPVKVDATDTQYYLVIGQVVIGGTGCASGISEFRQFLFGDYKKGGAGASYTLFEVVKASDTSITINGYNVSAGHYSRNYVILGLSRFELADAATVTGITSTGVLYLRITCADGTLTPAFAAGLPAQDTTYIYHPLADIVCAGGIISNIYQPPIGVIHYPARAL